MREPPHSTLTTHNHHVRAAPTAEDIHDAGDEMVLQFDDGTEHRADLVVGADGIRSIVRDVCFAGDTDPVFSGYQVCVTVRVCVR